MYAKELMPRHDSLTRCSVPLLPKFLSFSLAIREILDDFRSDPKQYDLFAKVYSFLVGGKAVPGEEKCPPMGIWKDSNVYGQRGQVYF